MKAEQLQPITVEVGYHGQHIHLRFDGIEIFLHENATDERGPNYYNWHTWKLYKVRNGFRVLDDHTSRSKWGKGHEQHKHNVQLSKVLPTCGHLVYHYPGLAHQAIKKNILKKEDCILDADLRDMLDEKTEDDLQEEADEMGVSVGELRRMSDR